MSFFRLSKPRFWRTINVVSILLLPLSLIYLAIVCLRYFLAKPVKLSVPVICVGNAVVGGSGKTPIAIAIARYLQAQGRNVAFASRGYMGHSSTSKNSIAVTSQDYKVVGDEALLLARVANTFVGANKQAVASDATKNGAQVVILDDGLQNHSIAKTFSILVVNLSYQFGNHMVLPSGPLREPLALSLAKADCILTTGEASEEEHVRLANLRYGLPVFKANLVVTNAKEISNGTFLVLAGIAEPERFLNTLKGLNITMKDVFIFGDHHIYTDAEFNAIFEISQKTGIKVLTTSKDYVKIPKHYLQHTTCLEIAYELPQEFLALLDLLPSSF
nr:tetraacyldisaccharide 4'-kinase [Rickettsiales endosymbiont of Peranema trichophorum]